MITKPAINLAIRRVFERVKRQINEDPELAKVPAQKLALVICEELGINPAIAVYIAEEVKKRRSKEHDDQSDV